MESHPVTYNPAVWTFPPLPSQLKLVLDLATQNGCKTDLTLAWLNTEVVRLQTVTHPSTNRAQR